MQPSCSGGPVCTFDSSGNPANCQLADRPFSFFFKEGEDDKVFVPACTGDVFWGSKDAQYPNVGFVDTDGTPYKLPGIDTDDITIHHRGFDNFLASLKWVGKRLGDKPHKVVVAGSSAGGYGAVTGFAFVKEVWPGADSYLIADAANGVIASAFTATVINNPASPWGQQGNLPTWIKGIDQLPGASNQFIPDFTATLANHYARQSARDHRYGPVKVAQYTTEWDVDQAFYYGAMQNPPVYVDLFTVLLAGSLDPSSPTCADQKTAYSGWHSLMDQYTGYLTHATARAGNYRYYRAAGYYHAILTETPPFILPDGTPVSFNPEGIFYNENSGGVPFNNWVRGMLGEPGQSWENQQCSGQQCNQPDLRCYPIKNIRNWRGSATKGTAWAASSSRTAPASPTI
ncbi:MAG: hypothetical protein NTX45_29715 [Proteobacteria bacterium]|nr:hypothetical protein [Pseudomonadota bacterium]